MDKKFETILRTGKTVNMLTEIELLQERYYKDLQLSVDSFDYYDEISEETRNDLTKVRTVLATFEMLGYISHEEFEAMSEEASEQRDTVLEEVKNERYRGN